MPKVANIPKPESPLTDEQVELVVQIVESLIAEQDTDSITSDLEGQIISLSTQLHELSLRVEELEKYE
jgi:hypothetical protein